MAITAIASPEEPRFEVVIGAGGVPTLIDRQSGRWVQLATGVRAVQGANILNESPEYACYFNWNEPTEGESLDAAAAAIFLSTSLVAAARPFEVL